MYPKTHHLTHLDTYLLCVRTCVIILKHHNIALLNSQVVRWQVHYINLTQNLAIVAVKVFRTITHNTHIIESVYSVGNTRHSNNTTRGTRSAKQAYTRAILIRVYTPMKRGVKTRHVRKIFTETIAHSIWTQTWEMSQMSKIFKFEKFYIHHFMAT